MDKSEGVRVDHFHFRKKVWLQFLGCVLEARLGHHEEAEITIGMRIDDGESG